MNKIYIHKGDSTVFANANKFLTFYIDTDLDLTGWTAKFALYTITKTVTDISNKQFEIILGANDTKELKLGTWNGAITLTDNEGNIKTVINTIPFEVTKEVVENQYQEIDLTIPESSGVDIKMKVGVDAVTSVNGMSGDVVIDIPDLTDYVKNTDYATTDKGGVVKAPTASFGLSLNSSKQLYVFEASNSDIDSKISHYRPITPYNLDLAVKTSVTTNTIELTADEKANAKQWLGYADNTDIMQAIASIPQFNLSIVEALPETGAKMTLYLVPKEGTNNDVYDEYVWIEQTTSYEHLGSTAVDLTDYVKNTDYATGTVGGVVKVTGNHGLAVYQGMLTGSAKTLDSYNASANNLVISKGTLENIKDVFIKRGLTENALELTDDEKTSARTWLGAIGNTDYAQGGVAGVVKASNTFACGATNGYLQTTYLPTMERYNNLSQYGFIGKGTLETVLTQYSKTVLTTEADYNALATKDANTLYLIEE